VDLRHRWCTEHRRRLKAHGTDAARYHEHAHKHGVDNKARARPSRALCCRDSCQWQRHENLTIRKHFLPGSSGLMASITSLRVPMTLHGLSAKFREGDASGRCRLAAGYVCS
jgi:hypothetical protein